MTLRSFARTATIALAAAALAAPAASARPAETPPVGTKATAAEQHKQARLPGPPTWPVNPEPIESAPAVHASDNGGLDWTTIGLGVAGSLLLVAGVAAVARHNRRIQRTRMTA